MLNKGRNYTAVVPLRAVRYLLLCLVVTLLYSFIGAALDIHPSLQRTTDCLLCQFTQNLSSAEGAAVPSYLPIPALLHPIAAAECSPFPSTASFSPPGSRSPPIFC